MNQMEHKLKSPLEQVAYEIESERMKELLSKRFKHIEESVYERIKREMHTERFNEVLSIVIEKHGVKESLNILTDCIQKVAQDSIITLLKKKR
jgi:hypothetical protein